MDNPKADVGDMLHPKNPLGKYAHVYEVANVLSKDKYIIQPIIGGALEEVDGFELTYHFHVIPPLMKRFDV